MYDSDGIYCLLDYCLFEDLQNIKTSGINVLLRILNGNKKAQIQLVQLRQNNLANLLGSLSVDIFSVTSLTYVDIVSESFNALRARPPSSTSAS